jgi:hypothetical protein
VHHSTRQRRRSRHPCPRSSPSSSSAGVFSEVHHGLSPRRARGQAAHLAPWASLKRARFERLGSNLSPFIARPSAVGSPLGSAPAAPAAKRFKFSPRVYHRGSRTHPAGSRSTGSSNTGLCRTGLRSTGSAARVFSTAPALQHGTPQGPLGPAAVRRVTADGARALAASQHSAASGSRALAATPKVAARRSKCPVATRSPAAARGVAALAQQHRRHHRRTNGSTCCSATTTPAAALRQHRRQNRRRPVAAPATSRTAEQHRRTGALQYAVPAVYGAATAPCAL